MLEINPRHPVILELLRRVQEDPEEPALLRAAHTLYRTAALRSGYLLQEGQAVEFAETVEGMLQTALGLPPDAKPEEEDFDADAEAEAEADADMDAESEAAEAERADEHEEL